MLTIVQQPQWPTLLGWYQTRFSPEAHIFSSLWEAIQFLSITWPEIFAFVMTA